MHKNSCLSYRHPAPLFFVPENREQKTAEPGEHFVHLPRLIKKIQKNTAFLVSAHSSPTK